MAPAIFTLLFLLAPAPQDSIPSAARATIAKTNAGWLEAMKRQDAAAIAAIYGDTAVFVTADGQSLRGQKTIEAFERGRFEKNGRVIDGTIEDDGLTRAGPYVYEWGHATLRVTATSGKTTSVTGRFLTVWAADANGQWRIIRNLSLAAN